MANTTFKGVEIYRVSRNKASGTNGNPRFTLHTDRGEMHTGVDASLGYGIENLTNKRLPETFVIGNPGVTVDLVGCGSRPDSNIIHVIRDGKQLM
ncbi:hypothetical protein HWC80_gp045 [Mycobacterium phage Indlulamithi]|uniref:Uncharacterized protein n=1 Tax=Mycobacterium phage Indlulamithi TaxID=2656582 RepID=A0A649VDD1_9CAUD|nr:hypothetical protein HWC80_gp045 [Mycobacterium phage Indlulamithi]QGJ90085.1 hypothetical protein PBI_INDLULAMITHI_45 [Mycobacterium phage Indlulamithi]